MRTFKRICVKDYKVADSIGNVAELKRGNEYLTTSVDENKNVLVFSIFWVKAPRNLFAGSVSFTK